MIYLDGSVALAYLLAEDRYPSNALWDLPVVSSRLIECEVWNRINTRRLHDSHGDAVRGLIGRIAMIEMVPPVLKPLPHVGAFPAASLAGKSRLKNRLLANWFVRLLLRSSRLVARQQRLRAASP
jgi:hypothetical protein